MSTTNSVTVELPRRKVVQLAEKEDYQVWELNPDGFEWRRVSKVYGHSTSAFAALGRLTQKDSKELEKGDQ